MTASCFLALALLAAQPAPPDAGRSVRLIDPYRQLGDVQPVGRSGEGTVTAKAMPGEDPFGSHALAVTFKAGPDGYRVWLPVRADLPQEARHFAFWSASRGAPWADACVVLESPEGVVGAYDRQPIGDSPWGRSGVALPGGDKPLEVLERTGRTHPAWIFRGWLLEFRPYQKGRLQFGSLELPAPPDPRAVPGVWTLKDVDESLRFQAAYIGFNISYGGTAMPVAVPHGLLGKTAGPGGNRTLSWELLDAAQARIAAGRLPLVADEPGRLLVLPVLPRGNFWFRWQIHGDDGRLLENRSASILVNQSSATALPTGTSGPALHRIWPEKTGNDLAVDTAAPESLSLPIAAEGDGLTLALTLKDAWGNTVEKMPSLPVGESGSVGWKPSHPLQGGARYELTGELRRNGMPIDQRTFALLAEPEPALPEVLTQAEPGAPAAGMPLLEIGAISIYQAPLQKAFIAHTREAGTIPSVSFNWGEIEPARDFYQWRVVDDLLADAVGRGLCPIFTLYGSLDHLPRWLWYDALLDQDMTTGQHAATYIRKASPTSKPTLEALQDIIRATVRRYGKVKAIKGWNFSQGVESFWSDASRNGRVVDYSATTARAFGEYLQARGWSLAAVSRALGRDVGSWAEVTPPPPVFDGELDLRPIWLAWQQFKQDYPAIYFDAVLGTVRAEDPHREIYQYAGMGAGDIACYVPVFARHRATLGFGGSGGTVAAFLQSIASQYGVPIEAEPAGVPPREPDMALTAFYKFAHGLSEGGINLMWGRAFSEKNTETLQGTARLKELLQAWPDYPTEPVGCQVAVGAGMRSIINRTRSFMWIDWTAADAYEWSSSLVSTVGGSSGVGYVTDEFPLEKLRAWPSIVWLESPLLADAAAERLAEYVRQGGQLLLCGQTGRYNEKGEETWHLRQLLEAAEGDESVRPCGKGRYQWLAQPLRWGSWKHLADTRLAWLKPQTPITSNNPDVRVALRRALGGEGRYLAVALGKNWRGGNPSLRELPAGPLKATVAIPGLPPGRQWTMTRLGRTDRAASVWSSDQLAQGVPVEVQPAEVALWELKESPAAPSS